MTEDTADYDVVAAELWELLQSFGVEKSAHVTDGYDVLMRKEQGLES